MAVVISSEDSTFFSTSSLKRTHSQQRFMSKQASNLHTSASTSQISDSYHRNYHSYQIPESPSPSSSSAPSSPQTTHADSVDLSYSSTPATNLSLDGHYEDDLHLDTGEIVLPPYEASSYFAPLEDLEPPTSPHTGDSYTVSPAEHDTSAATSRPDSPALLEHAEDDSAVKQHPTQHVDYLSHDWKEEDIWSSWRYIVARRSEVTNAPRLENASWRTWMKSKYGLKTVSPETLNWLKDCDVTWLYGPLQTGQNTLFPTDAEQGSSSLSRNSSFIQKKPILKKRSMSEVMLQKSLSSSSLLKQATAVVQAQQQDGSGRIARPTLQRAATDYVTFPFSSRRLSRQNSLAQSSATSGGISPCTERKHIHFDEQVKQCIAVEIKGEEEEDEESEPSYWNHDGDTDSDDGAIMMKRTKSKKKPFRPKPKPKLSINGESKTIAMLPSTTLKYRADTPDPSETAMKHSTVPLRSPLVSPSSSQETLRPSKNSGRFFVGDDEEFEADEETSTTPVSSPVDSFSPARHSGLQRSASANSLTAEPEGMRRTDSGMFMPYEEGDPQGNEGIIGRVIDTVHTARDIAHVIWNVGWRR